VSDAADNTMAVMNAEDLNLDFVDDEAAAAQQDARVSRSTTRRGALSAKDMLDAINQGASIFTSNLTKELSHPLSSYGIFGRSGAAADGDQG